MSRLALAGAFVTLLETSSPGLAQLLPERPTLAQVTESLIGLSVVSSDGVKLGVVVEAGEDDGEEIVIAMIDRPLGIGSVTVAIPVDLFVRRGDAIELVITAVELRANLHRPERK
jgi:PRC-barrel domain